MKSNKPTRDLNKKIPDPFQTFIRHIKKMINKNKAFWDLLEKNRFLDIESNPVCGDARTVPVPNNSVALMVTSPPYVTSYEYADLHQLSALWFNYTDDLAKFRKSFMGSAHNDVKETVIGSELGERIVEALQEHNTKKDKEVAIYFSEMHDSFIEMKRYLKKGGIASIVIGDTAFKGVPVLNAEVFVEQMQNLGFKIYKIIKRRIPSKILPSMRDKKTGRFTSLGNHNKTLAYSFEYIITMQKI
jgi:DNA modification methylase